MNVHYDFTGQTALITGGGRGQGRSHALGFARAGANVAIVDVCHDMSSIEYGLASAEELQGVADEVRAEGVSCLALECDVRRADQVAHVVSEVAATYGRIDVLVNNAGVVSLPDFVEMTEQTWDEVVDTNLKGVFLCCRQVATHMIAAGRGRIITTGSTNSLVGGLNLVHYAASKHAVVGLSKSLAIELAPHNITVNVVCPGGVKTPMPAGMTATKSAGWFADTTALAGRTNLFPKGGQLEPEVVTGAVLWLASEDAAMITGTTLVVDAGYTIK